MWWKYRDFRFKRKVIIEWIIKLCSESDKERRIEITKIEKDIIDYIIASNYIKPILPTPILHVKDENVSKIDLIVYMPIQNSLKNNKITVEIVSAAITQQGLDYIYNIKSFFKKSVISFFSLILSIISLILSICLKK